MKLISLRVAAQASVTALVFATSGYADDKSPVPRSDLQGKLQ